ncbi:MAG: hypothetical protein ACI9UN_004575 [Granulosicoccus sp.]
MGDQGSIDFFSRLDDKFTYTVFSDINNQNQGGAQISYRTGPDGEPLTADDTVRVNVGFIVAVIDGGNNRGQVVNFQDSTVDENATIIAYSIANFDSNQNALQTVTCTGDSADAIWFTTDDDISTYTLRERDTAGNLLLDARFSGVGVDGLILTADDNFRNATRLVYDANNSIDLQITYNGTVGAD